MDRQVRVEKIGEVDSSAFRGELEEGCVRVERPSIAGVLDQQRGLVVAVEELGSCPPGVVPIGRVDDVRADPVGCQDGHLAVGDQTPDSGTGGEVLKRRHGKRSAPAEKGGVGVVDSRRPDLARNRMHLACRS